MNIDRLYNLLPAIYRIRDSEQGYPLRSLLRVIAEQVDLVEEDIYQLYENWFIETCQDWVVPYIGDLVGYKQVHIAGEVDVTATSQNQQRHKILIPRRDVANTIKHRRRKGTLSVLEQIAEDVSGWRIRAVESYKCLAYNQNINHLYLERGRTVNLRNSEALANINGPFDQQAHFVEISGSNGGRRTYHLNGVDVFVWRTRAYSVTETEAKKIKGKNLFTFSALGNESPLFAKPIHGRTSDESGVPMPISRQELSAHLDRYYDIMGDRSFRIRKLMEGENVWQTVDPKHIVSADLKNRRILEDKESGFAVDPDTVAVDPELGKVAFLDQVPERVKVSYYYGFADAIGGGEYNRSLSQAKEYKLYRVGRDWFENISAALKKWDEEKKSEEDKDEKGTVNALIEILESGLYEERYEENYEENKKINIHLNKNESLQIRAANGVRPIIELGNDLNVTGAEGSSFTIDGLIIAGGALSINGEVARLAVRHSTVVPGLVIPSNCKPNQCVSSINIHGMKGCLFIENSIIGPINVDKGTLEPISISIKNSILDSLHADQKIASLSSSFGSTALAELNIRNSTLLGKVLVHSIKLAENTIFQGNVEVARRQEGCIRFCYVRPESRTPQKFNCQPDLTSKGLSGIEKMRADERVKPRFISTKYGSPWYCVLSEDCADEIKRGADDESEMGVMHDLYRPQREANLHDRLEEFTPADMEIGIVFMGEEEIQEDNQL